MPPVPFTVPRLDSGNVTQSDEKDEYDTLDITAIPTLSDPTRLPQEQQYRYNIDKYLASRPPNDSVAFDNAAMVTTAMDTGRKRALTNIWQNIDRKKYLLGQSTDPAFIEAKAIEDQLDTIAKEKKIDLSSTLSKLWLWWTIYPKSDVDILKIRHYVRKCVTKVWIDQLFVSFEQNSPTATTEIYGLHIHILFRIKHDAKDRRVSKAKTLTLDTLKPILSPNHTQWFTALADHEYPSKVQYMEGRKREHKMAKVAVDMTMRTQLKLEHIYTAHNIHLL